jgi:hypothetical protein
MNQVFNRIIKYCTLNCIFVICSEPDSSRDKSALPALNLELSTDSLLNVQNGESSPEFHSADSSLSDKCNSRKPDLESSALPVPKFRDKLPSEGSVVSETSPPLRMYPDCDLLPLRLEPPAVAPVLLIPSAVSSAPASPYESVLNLSSIIAVREPEDGAKQYLKSKK